MASCVDPTHRGCVVFSASASLHGHDMARWDWILKSIIWCGAILLLAPACSQPLLAQPKLQQIEVPDAVVDGLMYILSTGCQWRAIPKDLAARSTIHDYFDRWDHDGTLAAIHHALYAECRELLDREASPTAAVIDSQSVKSAEKGGPASIRMATTRVRKSKG